MRVLVVEDHAALRREMAQALMRLGGSLVVEVSYTLAVDPAASLEDNLAHAEAELTSMHAPLTALDIPARADG